MVCPYCQFLVDIMEADDLFNTDALYFNQILDQVPKFILRHYKQVKLFIEAYEKRDPTLLK